MFTKFWKRKIVSLDRQVQQIDEVIANIVEGAIPVFVEHGTGIVYSQKFGVKVPLRRETISGSAGGGGGMALRGMPHSITVEVGCHGISISHDAPTQEYMMFHKDRAPKCDYVVMMLDGSLKYFKKQAPLEVEANGFALKEKKTSRRK